MPNPSVFLSYRHQDEAWKKVPRTHLKVLEHVDTFCSRRAEGRGYFERHGLGERYRELEATL